MIFPFFIAKKFILPKKNSRFTTFISTITVLGIALGVATLIITLSILNGFENTITTKMMNFDSHIQIKSYTDYIPNYDETLGVVNKITKSSLIYKRLFVSQLAIIGSKNRKDGINIKGIRISDNWSAVRKDIISGKFIDGTSQINDIVIGKKLADKLFLKIGDRVTLFALVNNKVPSADNLPNIKKYKVIGIYESGMAAYDDLTAYVTLKSAQNLFEINNKISGIELKLTDATQIDSTKKELQKEFHYPIFVKTIYQLHRNIFNWIELQKKPIPIILTLIIIVAVFNIIGTLLLLILEKTQEIGVLRSLGASKKQIVNIFVYQGFILSSIGIIIGNLLAYVLGYLQLNFNIISIPSSVYLMSSVPIKLSLIIFIETSIVTLILCFVSSFIPSYIASKIDPIKTLRFN